MALLLAREEVYDTIMSSHLSAKVLSKIEQIAEYLVNNTRTPIEEVECYYEFCYKILLKARQFDESSNTDLIDVIFEEHVKSLHLALHGLLYEKLHHQCPLC